MIGTIEQQIAIEKAREESTLNKYINNFYKQLDNDNITDTNEGRMFTMLGFDAVVNKIQEYIDTKTTGARKKDKDMLMNICDDPKVLAYTTLSILLTYVIRKNNKVPLATICSRLLRILLIEQGNALVRENEPKMMKYMDSVYRRASKERKLKLMQIQIDNIKERVSGANGTGYTEGSIPIQSEAIRIGSALIECVVSSGIGVFEQILVSSKEGGKYRTKYIVRMTAQGKDILAESFKVSISKLVSTYPPMIVPPLPWTNNRDGGFITYRTNIIKAKSSEGYKLLNNNPMPKLYPVLNKLQNKSWRVNKHVLDVITYIFKNDLKDPQSPKMLPKLFGGLPTRDMLEVKDVIRKEDYGTVNEEGFFEDKTEFRRWKVDHEATLSAFDGEIGRRLQLLATLGEAEEFKDYDSIYFAYNLDTRGRVYSMQAALNPQGSAVTKSLLEFSDSYILTERGAYWLKIHTANVYGKDKENFDERIKWFESNIGSIRTCGNNPLNNMGDWAYSDSPFEFLAACKAWVDHEAGLPVHLQIQLDATNSGVQIYSGLLGDEDGAKTVNVVNVGKRADVYQMVADKVNDALLSGNYPKVVDYPTSDGKADTQSTYVEAQSITGKITRSIVKRNVMTVPYSVSKRGMSQQLWDIMDDARLKEKEWWQGDKWIVNKLLTDLNHTAIYDTIPGARVGQDYLVSLAALCNKKDGMIYTTPIYNIPVVQKKPKTEVTRVQTVLGTLKFVTHIPDSLDKMAQRNGSAPNYIHSIDSTLLLRVIETMSVDIGVIHDCFLCHPNYGDELQLKFKEAYVEIMRMKPLELIGKQLDPEGTIPVPYIGTLNLDDVYDSEYIIS